MNKNYIRQTKSEPKIYIDYHIMLLHSEASKLGEIGEVVSKVASLNAVQWLR